MTLFLKKVSDTVSSAGGRVCQTLLEVNYSDIFHRTKEGISQVGIALAHPGDTIVPAVRACVQKAEEAFVRVAFPFLNLSEEEKKAIEDKRSIRECAAMIRQEDLFIYRDMSPNFFQYLQEAFLRNDIAAIIRLIGAYLSPGILAGILTKSPYEMMRFFLTSQEIWLDILKGITMPKLITAALVSFFAQRFFVRPVYRNFREWQEGYWMNRTIMLCNEDVLYQKMPTYILEDLTIQELYQNYRFHGFICLSSSINTVEEFINEDAAVNKEEDLRCVPCNNGEDPIAQHWALMPAVLIAGFVEQNGIRVPILMEKYIYHFPFLLRSLLDNPRSPMTRRVVCRFTEEMSVEQKIDVACQYIYPLQALREAMIRQMQIIVSKI